MLTVTRWPPNLVLPYVSSTSILVAYYVIDTNADTKDNALIVITHARIDQNLVTNLKALQVFCDLFNVHIMLP